MQINTNSLSLSPAIGQTPAIDYDKTLGATQSRADPRDSVEISNLAQRAMSDPNQVEHLRAAYQSGVYNVSPDQIASSIINDALQAT